MVYVLSRTGKGSSKSLRDAADFEALTQRLMEIGNLRRKTKAEKQQKRKSIGVEHPKKEINANKLAFDAKEPMPDDNKSEITKSNRIK